MEVLILGSFVLAGMAINKHSQPKDTPKVPALPDQTLSTSQVQQAEFDALRHSKEDPNVRVNKGYPLDSQSQSESQSQLPAVRVDPDLQFQSLTGELVSVKDFHHNNELPFFKGTPDQFHHTQFEQEFQSKLERFTGSNDDTYIEKESQPNMFNPYERVDDIHGTSITSSYQDFDRIIPSQRRHMERPLQQIQVGPGLDDGYTWKPSGGFHQEKTRDFMMPRTVDELRTKNNPKLSYEGRAGPGVSSIQNRISDIKMDKNRPETAFYQGMDRVIANPIEGREAPRIRDNFTFEETGRSSQKREIIGPAGATDNQNSKKLPTLFRESYRNNLASDGFRNVDLTGKWEGVDLNDTAPALLKGADARNTNRDYGRSNTFIPTTIRESTENNSHMGHLNHAVHEKHTLVPTDQAKMTRKEFFIGAPRPEGHLQVADKDFRGWVRDPSDTPDTTIRETTESNVRPSGNIQVSNQNHRGHVRDPNDTAKTTVRETTHYEHLGPADQASTDGYKIAKVDAKTTVRETTHHSYGGNPGINFDTAYLTNPQHAREVNRQHTSNHEHFAGAKGHDANPDQSAYYNRRVHSNRENIVKNRRPTSSGPVHGIGSAPPSSLQVAKSTFLNSRTPLPGPSSGVNSGDRLFASSTRKSREQNGISTHFSAAVANSFL